MSLSTECAAALLSFGYSSFMNTVTLVHTMPVTLLLTKVSIINHLPIVYLSLLLYVYCIDQAQVVRKVDNAIHRINHYPADSVVCFVNTYPLDSDLSGG